MWESLERVALDEAHDIYLGHLPEALLPDEEGFARLWAAHPEDYHSIHLHGRVVKTPRWQQAYGADYHYTGRVNRALPMTPALLPFWEWSLRLDARLNGLLLNWYDGQLGHYIGKHRDSIQGMIQGSPILTLSLGEARTFRLRPWKQAGTRDFLVEHGSVLLIPWETNLAWTHEVPKAARYTRRRISITARAFAQGATEAP